MCVWGGEGGWLKKIGRRRGGGERWGTRRRRGCTVVGEVRWGGGKEGGKADVRT